MPVIDITSKSQFDALIQSHPYVALQAHASWCGPCKAISPFFVKHSDALSIPDTYAFARFDTDDVPDLAFELGIRTIPAFFFFENGDKASELGGTKPPVLKKIVEDIAEKAKASKGEAAPAVEAEKTEAKDPSVSQPYPVHASLTISSPPTRTSKRERTVDVYKNQ